MPDKYLIFNDDCDQNAPLTFEDKLVVYTEAVSLHANIKVSKFKPQKNLTQNDPSSEVNDDLLF